jgi:membrane protease YdiL (CAAX protease family)
VTPVWRISDVIWSLVAGIVAAALTLAVLGTTAPTAFETFAIVLPAQEAATLATFYSRARRRIAAPLRALGLPPRLGDAWLLITGLGLAIVATLTLAAFTDLEEAPQEIARVASEAQGLTALWAFLGTVVAAPVVEEVVFRGGLLRALERRMPALAAAAVSALAFAAFHYGGPDTAVVLPPLFALGLILAVIARRRGVGAAVYVHSGFNLLAALALLTG